MVHLSLRFRRSLALPGMTMVVFCALGHLVPFGLAAEAARRSFDIPAGDAVAALRTFATQSGVPLIYSGDAVTGVRTLAIKGEFVPRHALDRMLAKTDLSVAEDKATGALAVTRLPRPDSPSGSSSAAPPAPSRPDTQNSMHPDPNRTTQRKNPLALLGAWLALALNPAHGEDIAGAAPLAGPGSGSIIGTVSSAETRSTLQGAVVSLPGKSGQALTDNAGRFILPNVTPGVTEIVVSYTGFDDERRTVVVAASEPTRLAVELKASAVLTLEPFTVSTEREGHALAVTEQRNASNVKNVIAMDALGNLPTANVGELLVQMSGVSGVLDVEGNVSGVSVRGMGSALTRLNIDGLPNTDVTLMSFSGGMYEQLEVIKGQTPDQSADSIGGMINLKTRSTLGMTDKRRVSYNVGARWAPPFFDRVPIRALHPIHPLTNLAYQEVFDVRGGRRNLGISASLSYNENANDRDFITYDYRNSDQLPNYIWDYRTTTGFNNRHVISANLKTEYRLSDASKFELNLLYNYGAEPGYETVDTRAFTNQVIATVGANGQPTGTGGIMPGFSATFAEVRGVAASTFQINTRSVTFFKKNPTFTFAGEHQLGRVDLDYSARYNQFLTYSDAGKEKEQGELVMSILNVGFTLDRADPFKPIFRQTAGPDIYDIRSYTSGISYTMRATTVDTSLKHVAANLKYRLDAAYPLALKAGLNYREEIRDQEGNPRVWNRTATAPALPTAWMSAIHPRQFGANLPVLQPRIINPELSQPALWTENLYTNETQKYILANHVAQTVKAAYAMAQGRVGRFGYLAGLRFERTEVEGAGNIRGTLATAAQIPDPIARAVHDYDNRVTHAGSYDRSFPSGHAFYEFTANLIARASWSTSFGRAGLSALSPTATINDTARTVSARNPGIGPQYARNTDLSLEYYFSQAGVISAGYFKKKIKDYIITTQVGIVGEGANNGFDGLYAGYTLSSTVNGGTAEVEGWEFNYRQQLTFLPGLLRGIGLSANYTELKTVGNFGSGPVLQTSAVAGFIPRTANGTLTYNFRKFGVRVAMAYNGEYLSTYNASPSARYYRMPLKTVNAGLTYRWSPRVTLYCDATNVMDKPLTFYRYVPSQFRQSQKMQTALIMGVSGRY